MDTEKIKSILIDQKEAFIQEKRLIERDIDLNMYLKSRQIIFISGIRRSGKSSLLYLIKNRLKLRDNEFLYFNFDDERINNFTVDDFNKLYSIHLELYGSPSSPITFFFDEIHNTPGWEKFLNRIYEKGIKIYVTGSNAKLLNSEVSTALTGRNLVINLHPFSFKEYLRYQKFDYDLKLLSAEKKAKLMYEFNNYIKYGGFPLVVAEENLEVINAYYNDIIYRDIIARFKLLQVEEIRQIGTYFASNTSKLFSYSTIQKVCHIKSLSTVKNYMQYFSDSYLFFFLKKFDYSVRKQILNPRKVYISDLGFVSRIGFRFSEDFGRLLETIVYLQLKRDRLNIYYHSSKKECDFVIFTDNHISQAIQVTKSIVNPKTRDREVSGLIDAMKSYNLKDGLILTYDEEDKFVIEENSIEYCIKVKPVWKYLLDGLLE